MVQVCNFNDFSYIQTIVYCIKSIFVSCFNTDLYCVSKTNTIRAIVACLPAWWRFAQCLRRYRDTREMFPHLVNAFKYSTTFYVVTFTCLYYEYKGELNF